MIYDIFINLNCNLKCSYCTVNLNNLNLKLKDIKKNKFENNSIINILGGEPTLHPELEEILLFFEKNDKIKKIILFTNGLKINKLINIDNLKLKKLTFFITLHYNKKISLDTYDKYFNTFEKFQTRKKIQIIYHKDNFNLLNYFNQEKFKNKIILGMDIYKNFTKMELLKIINKYNFFNINEIKKLIKNNNNDFIYDTYVIMPDKNYHCKHEKYYCSLKSHFE